MERYPNNKKPARPIEAVEHKHAGKDREGTGDVDDPMSFEIGSTLSGGWIYVRQQADKKRDAAECNEYPTDDRD